MWRPSCSQKLQSPEEAKKLQINSQISLNIRNGKVLNCKRFYRVGIVSEIFVIGCQHYCLFSLKDWMLSNELQLFTNGTWNGQRPFSNM
jgi:hypothetical protein